MNRNFLLHLFLFGLLNLSLITSIEIIHLTPENRKTLRYTKLTTFYYAVNMTEYPH